jgi:hypothetical protein
LGERLTPTARGGQVGCTKSAGSGVSSRELIRGGDARLRASEVDDDLGALLASIRPALAAEANKSDFLREWLEAFKNLETVEVRQLVSAGAGDQLSRNLDWWAKAEELPPTVPLQVVTGVPQGIVDRGVRRTLVLGSQDADPFVMHVSYVSDVLNRSFKPVVPGRGILPQELLRVPNSQLVVTLRRLVDQTLADDIARFDKQKSGTVDQLQARIDTLRTVLEGLESLHDQQLVHGNLHPENIDRAGLLVDYSLRPPLDSLTPEQRVYLAPEVLQGRTLQASDIYAFGKLAQRVLGSYLWDNRILPNGLDSEAFEWLLDYCTLEDPKSRPSARTLISVLEGGSDELAARANRSLRSGTQEAIENLGGGTSRGHATSKGQVEGAVADAALHLAELVSEHPETALAVSSTSKAGRLLSRIALDRNAKFAHHKPSDIEDRLQRALMETFGNSKFEIDTQWRDRIHRLHFGFGISLDHDEQMPIIRRGSRLARLQAEYLRHVEQLSEARTNLLSKDTYLYTSGVAQLLSAADAAASSSEVAALRRWGHVIAVPDHGRWLYPLFQFDGLGNVPTEIEIANKLLDRSTPWEILSWWHLPRRSLAGRSLAQVLHSEEGPSAVESALDRISLARLTATDDAAELD